MFETSKGMLSRRTFLRGAGTVGVGALLAACAAPGGAPAGQSAAGGEAAPDVAGKEIKFYVFWGSPGAIAEDMLADPALESYIGTGNTIDFKSGFNQEAILTAVASGTPPDIGIWNNYLDFMARGVAIPLDDYIATSDKISADKFIPGNWDVIQYKGNVYGVPAFECFVRRGLNYNPRLVEEAGLDPEAPPVTWDELMVWHEKLTKFDSAGNLVQFGIDPYDAEGGVGPGNDGWFALESWGVTYFNEDTKEFDLDNEAVAESMDVMGEFVKMIGPDNLVGLRSVEGQGTWGGSFNAEVQAMIIEGYWHPGETVNEKPEVAPYNRSTWVPVPESRRGTKIQFGGGHMAQIFKDGQYKDEAWPVAEWIQSDHVCNLLFEKIGWLPAYLPYFENADQEKYPGLKFYFDSVQEATFWGPYIRNEIQAFVETQYQQVREAVFRGEMTGAQAAAQLQEECEKEWQQAGFA